MCSYLRRFDYPEVQDRMVGKLGLSLKVVVLFMFELPANIILSRLFNKLMDRCFAQTLPQKFDKTIKKWIKQIPKDLRPHVQNIQEEFRLYSYTDISCDIPFNSIVRTVCHKLQQFPIPAKEEWKSAFCEQWKRMRNKHSSQERNPFLNLPEQQVETYFDTLASNHGAEIFP